MSSRSNFQKLLTSWGLSQFFSKFKAMDLDETTAVYLKDNQLETIFGAKNYGAIIKFKLAANKYREENV